MKYMGSKNRHAKYMLPIILADDCKYFVEPFCGGCNITDKVTGPRIAADIDEDLICLWKAVADGWLPPESITESEYKALKESPTSPLKGYAAFALSYGAKKWGGWSRNSTGKRDYPGEGYRNAVKQFPLLSGVDFRCCDYRDLEIPDGSIVYCDPPYRGSTGYRHKFDHDEFWQWVRDTSKLNKVYVSEYSAPDDFKCLWEKMVKSSLTKDTGSKEAVERLFTLV